MKKVYTVTYEYDGEVDTTEVKIRRGDNHLLVPLFQEWAKVFLGEELPAEKIILIRCTGYESEKGEKL